MLTAKRLSRLGGAELALLSRTRGVFGLAAPATTLLLALASILGGGTRGGTGGESAAAATEARATAASLPAAFAAPSKHHGLREHILTSAPATGLLPLGAKPGPDTPLDQLLGEGDRPLADNGLCPPDMASIDDLYCVDRYEASLLEILPNGDEIAFSPYVPVDGHAVRAVSEPGVFPQAYISEIQAEEACGLSGKRLCKPKEWKQACMGPRHEVWGYGTSHEAGRCNDHGKSPVILMFGGDEMSQHSGWDSGRMNHPGLNQIPGTLAKAGSHDGCTNDYGVYDMVGNLHEWVADPKGTFQGGYYQDTTINGDGCGYATYAHAAAYHDYSTGFRCCADVAQ
jgi:sulfatase modifying factor 1